MDGELTRGGLTTSTRGPRCPGGCNRKAEGKVTRCRPPCCGRLPPQVFAPQRQPGSGPGTNPKPSPPAPTHAPQPIPAHARRRPAPARCQRASAPPVRKRADAGGGASCGAGPWPEERRGGPGRRPSAVRPTRPTFPDGHSGEAAHPICEGSYNPNRKSSA